MFSHKGITYKHVFGLPLRGGTRANKGDCKMGDAKLTPPLKKLGTRLVNLFSYMYVHLHLSCFVKVGAKLLIFCYSFV